MHEKKVTIAVPVYNEEKFIEKLLNSIQKQNFDAESCELLLIDGNSCDRTVSCIQEHEINNYYDVRIVKNEKRTVQYAMNLAVAQARGEYLIRLDAHSIYPNNYISELVASLDSTPDIVNVGGVWKVSGKGNVGEAYAFVLSSFFGVGNASYRLADEEMYVNTVPFGAFRLDVLKDAGGFDERLERNEDYELNIRLSRMGWKILLRPDLVITYFCRSTWTSILKHELSDGKWNVYSLIIAPYTFSVSHFIPMAFTCSFFIYVLCFLLHFELLLQLLSFLYLIYLLLDLTYTIKGVRTLGLSYFIYLFLLYPVHHIGCGLGSLIGLFTCGRFFNMRKG